ncbi:DUF4363 family protein [Clostridium weizhouense]|uniref:DUF4363 family protein n=1 Tax=Clostridium weizhouense TaxID=2859781 RepID=A0ABS7AUI7_9CLOT|nr:DUF4363 family protein [Clostridium weizhouense]MBW6411315.1 DUF4363 family protein [Clostridium weizhouense]
MKNVIFSILLFFSILILVYFSNNSLIKLCDNISTLAEDIEITLIKGEIEDAYIQSIDLLNLIHQDGFITSIYVNHQEFDNLVNDTVKLSVYLSHKDIPDANSTLHTLKYNTQNLKKLQKPTLKNIL